MDNTNYSFYVSPDRFASALDRFAQSLLGSLFDSPCSEQETKAVDSEHKKKPQSGMWRSFHLGKTTISTIKDYTDTQDELASGWIALKVLSGSAVTIDKETLTMLSLGAKVYSTVMTDDNANDAPSRKNADCSITVKGASNATRLSRGPFHSPDQRKHGGYWR
ncbi:hypothetical protein NDA14_004743 [Ustilago hordei]|nr:hypothetical protein NDA14_004743 [Ustilago hordei]